MERADRQHKVRGPRTAWGLAGQAAFLVAQLDGGGGQGFPSLSQLGLPASPPAEDHSQDSAGHVVSDRTQGQCGQPLWPVRKGAFLLFVARGGRWPCGLVTLCLHADTVPGASSVAWLGVGYFYIPRDDHQQPVLARNPHVSSVSLDKTPSQSPPGSYRPPTPRASHGTSMSTSS